MNAVRQHLIEEGLLSPSGRGQRSLKMREEDHEHARVHLMQYFQERDRTGFIEIEQEQDPTWARYFAWLAEGEEQEAS